MNMSERATLATKVERIVDHHGWGGLFNGIDLLAREYYEGDEALLAGVARGLAQLRQALGSYCPDAPGSHTRSTDEA